MCDRLRSFILILMASCLAVVLWGLPSQGQFSEILTQEHNSEQRPDISYRQRGNLHIANVRVDGVGLFQVASPAAQASDDRQHILPIAWRVNEIETRLSRIIDLGYDPDDLKVFASTLNNQSVILAKTSTWQQQVMTVTELDRQIDGTSNAISDIADQRATQIRKRLLQAHQERLPGEFQKKVLFSFLWLLGVATLSLCVRSLQRRLKKKWTQLIKETPNVVASDLVEQDIPDEDDNASSSSILISPIRIFSFTFDQRKNLNSLMRSLLWWLQVVLWLFIVIVILLIFPQTRQSGVWLVGIPYTFTWVLFAISVAKKMLDIAVKYFLHRWAEQDTFNQLSGGRVKLRIPTINSVLQEVSLYGAILVGTFLFLDTIKAPLTLVLAGFGLLGLSSQSLIKDWIGGILILWEDQYTQGDMVQIGDVLGQVEHFNLRITQIRRLTGELVTITNGSFTKASNLTYQWSQCNLNIEVAYNTDLDQAMSIIQSIADDLSKDQVWGQKILEKPVMLGIESFGESSITIRLLIKTKPMQPWVLEREFRRRLKIEFDQAGITIPFPQRSIWIESAPSNRLINHIQHLDE